VVSVAQAGQDGRQEFVVLEPDDEKYFSMVDNGKLFYFENCLSGFMSFLYLPKHACE
jgi:hypothetical protein